MRKDIYERVQQYVKQEIKPNYAEIARQCNADYRTIKTAYEKSLFFQNGEREQKNKANGRVNWILSSKSSMIS